MKTIYQLFAIALAFSFTQATHAQSLGMWSSEQELAQIPMSGDSWDAVLNAADENTGSPDVSDQDDNTNVYILAASIVSVRYKASGDQAKADQYKDKVVSAVEKIVAGGHPGGRSLAAGREVGAYVMAADLVGYRSDNFVTWLTNMVDQYDLDGKTMMSTFKDRPNNWGTMNFGSLVPMLWYIGDEQRLDEVRDYFVKGITVTDNPGYKYGDLSWQADEDNPIIINPCGATKEGMDISGLLPEEMRRGGSFKKPPGHTGYAWEGLQGMLMGARVLERYGKPVWTTGNNALYRVVEATQIRLENEYGGWAADGDDLWQLLFIDDAYGSNFACGQGNGIWKHGKNAGWGYVLGGDNAVNCEGIEFDPCTEVTTGKAEAATDKAIQLFPNPVVDIIRMEMSSNVQRNINIINTLGQSILSESYIGSIINMDLSSLPTGVYFLQVAEQGEKTIFTEKIIKE